MPIKYCPKCKTTKEHDLFFKNAARSDGLNSWCKSCCKELQDTKRYFENTKEERKLKAREYRSTPEFREYMQRYRERKRTDPKYVAQQLWYGAFTRAKQKGLEIDITVEWITDKLIAGVCEATGSQLDQLSKAFRPSLDRIVPDNGYTTTNTQVVCQMYNYAKNVFTDAEVLQMSTNMYNTRVKQAR